MNHRHLCYASATWLALCTLPAIASAQGPAMAPKAPALEKLAEKEAQKAVWQSLSAEQKAAALDEAKKRLETMKPKERKRLRVADNKEEAAIRGAIKRLNKLPARQRPEAQRKLRACIDGIVPPPGAPTQPRLVPTSSDAPVQTLAPAVAETTTQPSFGLTRCQRTIIAAGCRR